jgi:hypothetical protein
MANPLHHTIVERWVASAVWTSSSAIRCGGDPAENTTADLCLARDAQGRFYIPGPSLAGAARSFLARHLADSLHDFHAGSESAALSALFGQDVTPKQPAYASLLLTAEAVAASHLSPAVRDYVALNPETGLASDKAKFDGEVLPAGAQFPLSFELALPAEIPHGVSRSAVLQVFRWFLESFQGSLRLGAASRAGLGQGSVTTWQINHYDLRQRAGAAVWLLGRPNPPGLSLAQLAPQPLPEPAHRLTLTARFKLSGPILIRSREPLPGDPDFVHFREANASWITGSSLKGALRQRCLRIANCIFPQQANQIVETLFGARKGSPAFPAAGRLWLSECRLLNGEWQNVFTRVALDRFTGASLETALFSESPFVPNPKASHHWEAQFQVDVDPAAHRPHLHTFLQAFKDLSTQDLPLGGELAAGRGRSRLVSAEIRLSGYSPLSIIQLEGIKVQLTGWNQDWSNLTTLPKDKIA